MALAIRNWFSTANRFDSRKYFWFYMFHLKLNPLAGNSKLRWVSYLYLKGIKQLKADFVEMDLTHCATLLAYVLVVNKSAVKINLFI